MTDLDLRVGLRVAEAQRYVGVGAAPSGAAVIEGRAVDIVDHASGRGRAALRGDDCGLAVFDGLAAVLAD